MIKIAETKLLFFYIFFIVIFNFFVAGFSLSDTDFDIEKELPFSNLRTGFENVLSSEYRESEMGAIEGVVYSIASPLIFLVSLVVNLISYLILLLKLIAIGVSTVPNILNILIFTPLSIMIVFDYIIPALRGN